MNRLRHSLLVLTLVILTGCSSSPYRDGYPSEESWAVLPVQSLESAEAGIQLERMLKVLLASKGVQKIELTPETETQGTNTLMDSAHRLQNATQWAEQHNIHLGITGTVDDLYTDQDNRFQFGLTLKLINIESNETLWSTTGHAEGKPDEDPYAVSRTLLNTLLVGLPLTEKLAPTGFKHWFSWLPGI